jgi:porphobilinogen synthase
MKNRNVDKSRNIDKNQSIDSDFRDNTTFILDKHSSYELFPKMRLRRLRKTAAIRELFQEIRLSPKDFVMPIFVQEGINKNREIESMPGIFRYSPDKILEEIDQISTLGIKGIILFGIPLKKDPNGKNSFNDKGIVQETIKSIKKNFGEKLAIITDVCLCQYTSHGHCGIFQGNEINNDKSLDILSKTALSHAVAGADIVAPSAMMDGQVKSIRDILDDNEFKDTLIMGYSAKQASSFFSPFRDAAHSKPEFGNRLSYQMSYHNSREAGREIKSDVEEGADVLMIKPAIPNLDLIYAAKQNTLHPIAAYSVSGEYSMIKAATLNNWMDENLAVTESLTAIKRAGANIIISYYAKKMAEILRNS